LIEHQNQFLRETTQLLQDFKTKDIDPLLTLLKQAIESDADIQQQDILVLCNFLREALDRQIKDPGLIERLHHFLKELGDGLAAHGMVVPLVDMALHHYGEKGAFLVGAVGLSYGIYSTIKNWLTDRKTTRSLPPPEDTEQD
ncbi:MAG: hypothetical protein JRI95_12905, partial [Deltaproteobacteria bacterium]|nr:hypothetical protein [Deltaproteobacteria bacterium]